MRKAVLLALALLLPPAALGAPTPARAETGQLRIAQQFGIAYLPLIVAKERKLIEARGAGGRRS